MSNFLLLLCVSIVKGTCDIPGLYSITSRCVSPFPIGTLSACVLLILFHCILHFFLLLPISFWNIQDSSHTVFWHENIILLIFILGKVFTVQVYSVVVTS
jgi:hypothetical protein